MDDKPLVSICCITFNHAPYLKECLDGFVMQQTNFKYEVIIHDDASTDGTQEIIKEYTQKYPDIFKPILQTENQYSKGVKRILATFCYPKAKGKYIALCEGDDYWTDPLKLQKQVDFLEAHPDIVYTCHRYLVQVEHDTNKKLFPNKYLDHFPKSEGFEFDLEFAFNGDWIAKTLTALFRKNILNKQQLMGCKYYRDAHLVYDILSQGNGFCFQFVGGVYRKQKGGVWSQINSCKKLYTEVKTWEEIAKRTPSKFNKNKLRRCYTLYVHESLKNKNLFKVENLTQLKLLFQTPTDYINLRKEHKHQNELDRIKNFKLNQD